MSLDARRLGDSVIRTVAIRGLDLVALRDWQAETGGASLFARLCADEGVAVAWHPHGFELFVNAVPAGEDRRALENRLSEEIISEMTRRWRVDSVVEWDFFYCTACEAGTGCRHDEASKQERGW